MFLEAIQLTAATVRHLRQASFLLLILALCLRAAHSQNTQADRQDTNLASVARFTQNTHHYICGYQGQYYTGSWAGCYLNLDTLLANTSSIAHRNSALVDFAKVGDAMDQYIYMNGYGKSPQGDDEGIGAIHYQMAQYGIISGKVSSVTTGENATQNITFKGPATCASVGAGSCSNPNNGYLFSQGALAYDATQAGNSFTPTSVGSKLFTGGINTVNFTGVGILVNTLATPFIASTAWGTIKPATCTGGLAGKGYKYQLTTCTVVLGVSPASPGNFTPGSSVTISASFEETVTLTDASPRSGGTQKISFYTTKNWDFAGANNGVVMQGGNSGDLMVQGNFGWKIVGATSASQAVISNCFLGYCQTNNPISNLPHTSTTATIYHGAEVSGTGGGAFDQVQLTTSNFKAAPGDIISQPLATSWFGSMLTLDGYKATPESYVPNAMIQLSDEGAAHYGYGIIMSQTSTGTPATGAFDVNGSYRSLLKSFLRPWAAGKSDLGTILEVGLGSNPIGSASSSYYLLVDDGGGGIKFTPGSAGADILTVSNLSATFSVKVPDGAGNYISSPRYTFGTNQTGTQVSSSSAGNISFDASHTGDGQATIHARAGYFLGAVTTPQTIAGGPTPTMAPGAAAGTSPACSTVTGANMAGAISCTTGTAPAPSSTLATITFHGTLSTAPQGCSLMPRNAATALIVADEYTTAPTATAWTIAVGATPLAPSTTYSWSYRCE